MFGGRYPEIPNQDGQFLEIQQRHKKLQIISTEYP
jgi:hypothetical protein